MIDINKSPHRVAIISVSCVITASLFVSLFYFLTPVPWCKELCTQLLFPAIYSIAGGLAVIWAGEESVKTLLRLRERISHGLTHKRILLAGDKQECANVEAQLRYSRLFDGKNITNISTDRTSPDQAYNSEHFTKYDLVILCFSGKPQTPISDQQAQLLSETLSSIGDDEIVKNDIEAGNSEGSAVGLIVLCPRGSLLDPDKKNKLDPTIHRLDTNPFERPFTVVVNQIGRMMTDIFSLLTTLPPRSGE